MAISPETTAHIRQRAVQEAKRLLVLFVYLALLLGSFTVYRRLVLSEYQISYRHYGYSLLEAFILAKVIMVGELLKLGERFRDRPLVIPAIYKAVIFGLLVLAFTALEDLVDGLFHDQSLEEILRQAASGGMNERVAQALVILVAFVPLFAFRELARLMGEGKLYEAFFRRRHAANG